MNLISLIKVGVFSNPFSVKMCLAMSSCEGHRLCHLSELFTHLKKRTNKIPKVRHVSPNFGAQPIKNVRLRMKEGIKAAARQKPSASVSLINSLFAGVICNIIEALYHVM
jgi:hypothetical protein